MLKEENRNKRMNRKKQKERRRIILKRMIATVMEVQETKRSLIAIHIHVRRWGRDGGCAPLHIGHEVYHPFAECHGCIWEVEGTVDRTSGGGRRWWKSR
jgi:hypothetical protein